MKTALILGSSGLTGSFLLQTLIADERYAKIVVINRKKSSPQHSKITELITDFHTPVNLDAFDRIDSVFSCLGTTRKQTPDLEKYRKIEIQLPAEFARMCLSKGMKDFLYISSVGANSNSSNFYLKMKGESEQELSKLGITHLHIYQPSFLIGPRKDKRILEKMVTSIIPFFDFLWVGKASKYKSMPVDKLAKGMISKDVATEKKSIEIYHFDEIVA